MNAVIVQRGLAFEALELDLLDRPRRPAPRFATMTSTFTSCPGTTTPSSASASILMPLASMAACWNSRFLLPEAEVDLVPARPRRWAWLRSFAAQHAHREEAVEQRLHRRLVVHRVERFLRDLDGVGRSPSALRSDPSADARRRTSPAPMRLRVDAVEQRGFRPSGSARAIVVSTS